MQAFETLQTLKIVYNMIKLQALNIVLYDVFHVRYFCSYLFSVYRVKTEWAKGKMEPSSILYGQNEER